MKINLNKSILALGISAMATVALAQDQNMNNNMNGQQMSGMNGMAVTPQHFVWEAAMTDQKEIHAGQLALQKSDNSDVKSYAKMLIKDHTKADKKLQGIAEKEGLNFPDTNSMGMMNDRWHTNGWNGNTGMNADNDATNMSDASSAGIGHKNYKGAELLELGNQEDTNDMDSHMINLEMLSGADFDRAFAAKMVMGHEKAIQKFEAASANLQDADLKKYAEKCLPTLREHLQKAQALQSKVGMWSDNGMTNSAWMNHNQ